MTELNEIRQETMKKVIVVGSLNTDMVIRAPYCPKGGETLMGDGFMTNCGGKGANQATAAAKLGAKTLLCGCVGEDMFGETLIRNLERAGADTSFVRKIKGVPTGTAVIIVTNGENRIVLDRGANARLSAADIDAVLEEAEAGDVFLTQLENPVSVVGYGLKRAKEKGLITLLNPAPADRAIAEFFPYTDYIVPNETELEILGGKEELFAQGIKKIVTTLGSKGHEYCDGGRTERYACVPVNVVDTTGAGDTFCGGMAAMLAEGKGIEEAMSFGAIAAGLACTVRGAADSIPTRKQTEAFRDQSAKHETRKRRNLT